MVPVDSLGQGDREEGWGSEEVELLHELEVAAFAKWLESVLVRRT